MKRNWVALARLVFIAGAVGVCSSCSAIVGLQPQVSKLSYSGQYDQALKIVEQPAKYGNNNELLRLLDQAMVLHLAGRYEESNKVFEQAKQKYDQLYTQSVGRIAGSWVWNDYMLPYRGEDFERILINVFEAINYVALGKFDEALVEARDVDSTLNAINDQYGAKQKNVYREDAFARFLMGVLYEADGKLNDAVISYRLSWQAYELDYKPHYGTSTPKILKQNLLAAAQAFGDHDFAEYRDAFSDIQYAPLAEKQKKAEVYLIEYQGLSPQKVSVQIPLPLADGIVTQLTFPVYQRRSSEAFESKLTAALKDGALSFWDETQLGEDIEAIAIKNLEDRRVRVMAKAAARSAAKYFAEREIAKTVEKKHGQGSADAIRILGSIFNLVSEQADTRSWLTLPSQIRMGRVILEPGLYTISVNGEDLGDVDLKPGEKKFFVVRTKL